MRTWAELWRYPDTDIVCSRALAMSATTSRQTESGFSDCDEGQEI